jgi:hypothetical protein
MPVMNASRFVSVVTLLAACGAQPSATPLKTPPSPTPVPIVSASASAQTKEVESIAPQPSASKPPLVDGVIFQDPALIMALTQDATHLFLGTSKGVMAVSKADGTRAVCSDSGAFTGDRLVVSDSHLYWPAVGGIEQVPKDCSAIDGKIFAEEEADVDDLRVDGKELYWDTNVVARTGDEPTSGLFHGSTETGSIQNPWSGRGIAHVLGFDVDHVYFEVETMRPTRPIIQVSRKFFEMKKRGGTVSPWSFGTGKSDATLHKSGQMAFDSGRVFIASHSRSETKSTLDIDASGLHATLERTGSVLDVADPNGAGFASLTREMCPLVPLPTTIMRTPEKLRVVGAWIYWECRGGGPDAIHRMSVRGGDVETVALVDSATQMSMGGTPLRDTLVDYLVDGRELYWAVHGATSSLRRKTLTP